MAKSKFERTKPHVNFSIDVAKRSTQRSDLQTALTASGVSAIGANQFAFGQIVSSSIDRQRLMELMHTRVVPHDRTGA